jgi:hypothetical protein
MNHITDYLDLYLNERDDDNPKLSFWSLSGIFLLFFILKTKY